MATIRAATHGQMAEQDAGFGGVRAELTGETRGPDAFKKFASEAGMEVLGPPLAQTVRQS